MKDNNEKAIQIVSRMIDIISEAYPDGHMPTDEVIVVFGMTIVSSLSDQPFEMRQAAAETLSEMIINPPPVLVKLRDFKVN